MKLRPKNQNLTQPRIFEGSEYVHPWYEAFENYENKLIKPNPPSKEAIRRAEFKDKTYHWKRNDSI